jgi:Xaa-Pro aminopeptidase
MQAVRREAGVGAMLVSREEDVGYLGGFTGEDSFLLLGRGWASLITDGRFDEQARMECPGLDIHVRTGPVSQACVKILRGRGVRRLGLQSEHATLLLRSVLQRAMPGKRIEGVPDVLGGIRSVKDAVEIRTIRHSIRIAEEAFRSLIAGGAKAFVGRPERRIAAELDYRMRLAGADGASFETIVAAGPHASLPHYRPGDTKVRRGDAVLIDWGAFAGGYASDLTRVVFTGKIPPKIAEVYAIVERAQQAGIRAVGPGVSGKKAHEAAQRVIDAAGYGERFIHSLGHGLGRMIHEMPALAKSAKSPLKAGMVVTVEPGIYLPGVGGVRIEDDVLVTTAGRQKLSSLPTQMQAMVLR